LIPPLVGFFGKQSVLLSAIGSGYYFMALVAIIVSVISASYYLSVIKDLHTSELNSETNGGDNTTSDEKNNKTLFFQKLPKQRSVIKNNNNTLPLKPEVIPSGLIASLSQDVIDDKVDTDKKPGSTSTSETYDSATLEEFLNYSSYGSNLNDHFIMNKGLDLVESGEISILYITNIHSFIISFLTLSILFFALKPSIILNSVLFCTLNYYYVC